MRIPSLLKGWVDLGMVESRYVYRQHLYTVGFGNGSATTLFLEVFTQRNFVADYIRSNLNLIPKKTTNSLFKPPFGGVRNNVRTSSIARWKACGRLPIRYDWTFFASSCGWADIGRSRRFSNGVGHFKRKFQVKGSSPTNLLWYHKTRLITLSRGIKILAVCSFISSQSTRVTDGWTDRRTDRITIPKTALA